LSFAPDNGVAAVAAMDLAAFETCSDLDDDTVDSDIEEPSQYYWIMLIDCIQSH